ncbi:helix-turn-helix transcriptional regulator [Aquabacterium sp. A7-Y]|uniref:helix-turn-helix domain-containing protein n=1 Tax=Aquabacterium sp. A7-Y TaxID=1349605 RepID=UPI00223E751B|nr:helix-turn-helix domain-containing protein [Aquabacterium sp. A7-Y]MCW7538482.1 helix-turn-helix transcriptional regulator [Aquabacterium sp. A7-Y]
MSETLIADVSASAAAFGARLKALRQARRLSQQALAARAGVAARQLSLFETGRARPEAAVLRALLDVLDVPLAQRNELLVQAGHEAHYPNTPLEGHNMQTLREALLYLLTAHEPRPAMVLDSAWNVLLFNRGMSALLRRLSGSDALVEQYDSGGELNLLDVTLAADGLYQRLINRDEVLAGLHQRLSRELPQEPALQPRLEALETLQARLRRRKRRVAEPEEPPEPPEAAPDAAAAAPLLPLPGAPVFVTRWRSALSRERLNFFASSARFVAPQDITAASLHVEQLYPADERTRAIVAAWLDGR